MKELDTVSLKSAAFGMPSGSIGVIVHEQVKNRVFLAEFCDSEGRTLALEDISRDNLRLFSACCDLSRMSESQHIHSFDPHLDIQPLANKTIPAYSTIFYQRVRP